MIGKEPLHLLDSLVDEVLDSQSISFLRKETRVQRLSSKDVKTSAAVNTFQREKEEKSQFPASFWLKTDLEQQ